MISTFISAVQENASRISSSIMGAGLLGNIASNVGLINEIVGIIAGLTTIVTAILFSVLKYKTMKRNEQTERISSSEE